MRVALRLRSALFTISVVPFLLATNAARAGDHYLPAPGNWEHRSPADVGLDPARVKAAIEFAQASESHRPRDLALSIALSRAREPYDAIIGPTQPRGPQTGVIVRHGYVIAEWGEPDRADMTFSISKSFLSAVVGIAVDRKRIADVNAPVRGTIPGPYFDAEHNRPITWDQLLRQTSNWQGTLWEKPDWADRPTGDDPFAWPSLPVAAPGTAWEYNDVRVNLLALAALHVWRKPLPEVLRTELMDPIGASKTWHWEGYSNSWVDIDGERVQSVSGGGHWGGGMFISAWDLARFGLLCLHQGRWGERTIWSDAWQRFASTPTPQNPDYGVMNWFLNGNRKQLPSAPGTAIVHLGDGTNLIYVDSEHDLVIVLRWIEDSQKDAIIARVLGAIRN